MRTLPFLLLPLLATACRTTDSPPATPVEEAPVRADLNENFLAEDLDVADYIRRFEGESREVAVARDEILAALAIEASSDVADIGAGTGLFLAPLAAAVGPQGKLFAVDISPGFIEHLKERVADEGLARVDVIHCTERASGLAPRSVDTIFICDTYHHFSYPSSTLASLHAALRPGGRLVVVDFERIPGVTREWLLDHMRADKATFRAEIEAAGFVFVDEPEVDGLEENYLLRFRRP